MSLDPQKLMLEIREVIAEIGEIEDPESIAPTQHFTEELDLDSMMLLELLSDLERRYQLSIPEEELPKMIHLQACVDIVQRLAAAQSDPTA